MIQSIIKAIQIMKLFSSAEPRLTLTEISRRLDIPKSTAHNILKTLISEGFIEKVDGDAYALGTAIVALGQGVRVNVELRDRAAPLIRELADLCRESVYLTVRDGDRTLYIYAVESSRRLLARSAVGDRAPLHCTSVGKAILASLPDAEIDAIVARTGLPAFTPHTLTDPDALRADLEETRRRGYSIDRQEHELRTFCIGAPVLDHLGHVIGACSISGADPDIIGSRRETLAPALISTAQEISRRMGFVPATPSRVAHPPSRNKRRLAARESPPYA
jgi:DNA-binding IclR family transcriptional regulator